MKKLCACISIAILMVSIMKAGNGLALDTPMVVWHSQPLSPGQTLLLFGEYMPNASVNVERLRDGEIGSPGERQEVYDKSIPMQALQLRTHSGKFLLPENMHPGIFLARVASDNKEETVLINVPQLWWLQGDGGLDASPGGWVRAFGTCLAWKGIEQYLAGKPPGSPRTTVIMKGPRELRMVAEADCYSAKIPLPEDLPEGIYNVYVNNGCGGVYGWSEPQEIAVKRKNPWERAVYDVRDFDVVGDGSEDVTAIVRRIINRAASAGGGVIYFPAGEYQLSGTLNLPANILLRGERRDLVHLYWTNKHFDRLEYIIRGTHDFGLEELTLNFVGADNGISNDFDTPCLGNVLLKRIRVRWQLFGGYLRQKDEYRITQETCTDWHGGAKGCLVELRGPNIRIIESDLYSATSALALHNADGAIVKDNVFYIGALGYLHVMSGSKQIWENNQMIGSDTRSRAGIFFSATPGCERIYFCRNDVARLSAWDLEALSTDGASPQYFGGVASVKRTTVVLSGPVKWRTQGRLSSMPDPPVLHLLFVYEGKGRGQCRKINGSDGNSITIDKPFKIEPDSTSIVCVNQNVRDWLMVGNHFADATSVQIYGIGFNMLLAENVIERIGGAGTAMYGVGFWHGGDDGRATEPEFFVQMLNNKIIEAKRFEFRDWHQPERMYSIGTGALGFNAGGRDPHWQYPFIISGIIRNNQISGGHIALSAGGRNPNAPLIDDVIIEGNQLHKSHLGILIPKLTSGILLRGNAFYEVEVPFSGDGLCNAWLHPAEATMARMNTIKEMVCKCRAQKGYDLAPIERQLNALMQNPVYDEEVKKACEKISLELWACIAGTGTCGHSPQLLKILIGVDAKLDVDKSTLKDVLASGAGGKGTVAFRASLPQWAPGVQISLIPSLPAGWASRDVSMDVRLSPGQEKLLEIPLFVPKGTWGPYDIPVRVNVSMNGNTISQCIPCRIGEADISEWMIIGPFSNADKEALDPAIHPPQYRIDVNGVYNGAAGRIRWKPVSLSSEELNLKELIGGNDYATAYAMSCVRANEGTEVLLSVESGGGCQVWLNDSEAFDLQMREGGSKESYLSLKKGDNILLVKSCSRKEVWHVNISLKEVVSQGRNRLQTVPANELKDIIKIPAFPKPPASAQIRFPNAENVVWEKMLDDEFQREYIGSAWQLYSGDWVVADGILYGKEGGALVARNTRITPPVRIEYDICGMTNLPVFYLFDQKGMGKGYAIAFSDGDPRTFGKGYTWSFDANRQKTTKMLGRETTLSTYYEPLGTYYERLAAPDKWHHVIAQLLPGGWFQLFVDGRTLLTHKDPDAPDVLLNPSLWTWGGGRFDNVKIYKGWYTEE